MKLEMLSHPEYFFEDHIFRFLPLKKIGVGNFIGGPEILHNRTHKEVSLAITDLHILFLML